MFDEVFIPTRSSWRGEPLRLWLVGVRRQPWQDRVQMEERECETAGEVDKALK